MKKKATSAKKKKIIICVAICVGIISLIILGIYFFFFKDDIQDNNEKQVPTLAIDTPKKVKPSEDDEFTLDVKINTLGVGIYPAASMSISFDASRLEFVGIEEGNVFVGIEGNNKFYNLPEWSCNPEQCNKTGLINIMYLDLTAGKNAFNQALLAEDDNVVIRLKFRLRGSVRQGDVCDLIFEDAVFAASNESDSLAMTKDTLKVRNGKIIIGE